MIPLKPLYTYSEFERIDHEDGRLYNTPDGFAPSVTTILSTIPNHGLDEWKISVGNEEADRITTLASDFGTSVHLVLESIVLGKSIPTVSPDVLQTANGIFKFLKRKSDIVYGVEAKLHYYDLYAGTTDLVCRWNNETSITDFKTSKKHPFPDKIKKYLLQAAAYTMAHDYMFGTNINRVDIICGVYGGDRLEILHFYATGDKLKELKREWALVVDSFYNQ